MPNESGDLKLQANFGKLIGLVSADTDYKPSNAALKPTALEAQHTAGMTAAHDVPAQFATNMTAISDREGVFADVLAEDDRAAEEAKLQQQIDEHMNRIAAEVDWLASLDPIDLQTNVEVEETMARNFATWNELDAVMRLRCRDFPDKLARWEEQVMKPMRMTEAIFEAGVAAEKAKPEN